MQVYQERRKIRKFFHSRPVLIFLSLFALFLLVVFLRVSWRAYQAHNAREKVEEEYQELSAQKARLEKEIQNLENPESLEKEAKERFNVTAPGEKVLVIVEPKAPGEGLVAKPPYKRFWEFLKNIFR